MRYNFRVDEDLTAFQDHIFFLLCNGSPPDPVSAERHLRRTVQRRALYGPNGGLFLQFPAAPISFLSELVKAPV